MIELSSVGVLTAFVAGTISFLSPCVLPLVPGYVSYVAGTSLDGVERSDVSAANLPALGLSLLFVLGFSTVFVALGPALRPSANCSSNTVAKPISLAAPSLSSSVCS